MPKYLFEGSYSAEGAQGVASEGGSSRRTALEEMARSVGGRLEAFYFTFGERDFVIVVELPDHQAAAAVSVAVRASGSSHPVTTLLLTPEDFDLAVKTPVGYRPPGHPASR